MITQENEWNEDSLPYDHWLDQASFALQQLLRHGSYEDDFVKVRKTALFGYVLKSKADGTQSTFDTTDWLIDSIAHFMLVGHEAQTRNAYYRQLIRAQIRPFVWPADWTIG